MKIVREYLIGLWKLTNAAFSVTNTYFLTTKGRFCCNSDRSLTREHASYFNDYQGFDIGQKFSDVRQIHIGFDQLPPSGC